MPRKRSAVRSATLLKMEQIVRLQMLGRDPEHIAGILGCTAGDVNDLIKHREYAAIRERYVATAYEAVDQVIKSRTAGQLLEDASADAAEALISLLYNDDPVVKDRAARSVLDRAGFGPIQRKAVRQRIELDPVTARLFKEALSESEIEGDFVDVTPKSNALATREKPA